MIELKEVTKEYSKGIAALNGINLRIEQGEFVFVVGDKKDGQPEGDRSSNQRNGAGEKRFWNRVWCDRLCNAASQH